MHFEGSNGEKMLSALFDSGASYSSISPDHASSLGLLDSLRHPIELATASLGHYLKIEQVVRLDFYFNDIRLSDEFMVIPNLSEDVIIGVNTMQKWRIKLDFEHDTVIVDPKVAKAMLKNLK